MRYGFINATRTKDGFYDDIILTSTKTEIGLWDWFNWDHRAKWEAYETIEPYNKKLGIQPNDLVISLPDPSVGASLYLMNQKGWNEFEFRDGNYLEQDRIADKIKLGAKYLFIADSSLITNQFISPYTKHKLGQYKDIVIFDLRPYLKF